MLANPVLSSVFIRRPRPFLTPSDTPMTCPTPRIYSKLLSLPPTGEAAVLQDDENIGRTKEPHIIPSSAPGECVKMVRDISLEITARIIVTIKNQATMSMTGP